jgi:hypothetical protein
MFRLLKQSIPVWYNITMKIEVMECHERELSVIHRGWALMYLKSLFTELPEQYPFESEKQMRTMAIRMEAAIRALERGNAVIIPDDIPDKICRVCPALGPCFAKKT